jgi:hypothetical protein
MPLTQIAELLGATPRRLSDVVPMRQTQKGKHLGQLTETQLREIRRRAWLGRQTHSEIAADFGVTKMHVYRIAAGTRCVRPTLPHHDPLLPSERIWLADTIRSGKQTFAEIAHEWRPLGVTIGYIQSLPVGRLTRRLTMSQYRDMVSMVGQVSMRGLAEICEVSQRIADLVIKGKAWSYVQKASCKRSPSPRPTRASE